VGILYLSACLIPENYQLCIGILHEKVPVEFDFGINLSDIIHMLLAGKNLNFSCFLKAAHRIRELYTI